MRSIWNGAISFGLVSIPIKLVNATESHSISFRQIHLDDGGRVRYRKVCELEDREVSTPEIGKAYEDADGTLIPITDEDLSSLPIPTARTIEIVAFVPADRIDPLQMDTAYYLSANGVPAAKPYVLLREALKRSQKVAVAKFALRDTPAHASHCSPCAKSENRGLVCHTAYLRPGEGEQSRESAPGG